MNRPETSEYDPYYEKYISLVADSDIIGVLGAQPTHLQDIFTAMPEEKGEFRYAE